MTEWVAFGASAVGTSHARSGVVCQDDCFATVEVTEAHSLAIGIASDGAGSAPRSEVGAARAVHAMATMLGEGAGEIRTLADAVTMLDTAFRAVHADLTSDGPVLAREIACTLLVLIASSEGWFLAGQVGDGAIVTCAPSGSEVAIEAVKGEYANQTVFMTQPDALSYLRLAAVNESLNWGALCTDGIEMIAINQGTAKPHIPFFIPFLDALESLPPMLNMEHNAALEAALTRFLDSDTVNSRVDDDKTLVVLAARDFPALSDPRLSENGAVPAPQNE